MARSWLSTSVELVEGRGESVWPRPGRTFAARRTHTFWQPASAIDDVGEQRIDPLDVLGIEPDAPPPYWGWGAIPDQDGRGWAGDDGEGADR